MSIITDATPCYTFQKDPNFCKDFNLTENIGFVPMHFNNKIYIFKVKINEAIKRHDCSYKTPEQRGIDKPEVIPIYLDFSILYKKKEFFKVSFKDALKTALKNKTMPKFVGFKISEKSEKIKNSFYTQDFYSFFSPDGFLPTEILFSSKTDAINFALKTNINKFFIYSEFKKHLDKKVEYIIDS